MTKRIIRALGRAVVPVGFGTWPIGGRLVVGDRSMGRGDATDGDAIAVLREALARGIEFFDTADFYGAGRAERLVGEAFSGRDVRPLVCTKFGNRIVDDAVIQDFSPAWLEQSVDASLARMKLKKLDILLLHSPPDNFDWSNYDKAPFENLIRIGKIGCYGVSCRSFKGAQRVLESGFGSVIEVIYNVVDRRAENRVLPLANQNGVSVIARVPLAYGLLGRPVGDAFETGDHRLMMSAAERDWLAQAGCALSFLSELPGGLAVSAIRFCLTDERVAVVIPGMHKLAHVESAAMAAELGPLPDDIVERIERAVPRVFAGWQ